VVEDKLGRESWDVAVKIMVGRVEELAHFLIEKGTALYEEVSGRVEKTVRVD
jgi:hypothetical protein